MLTAEQVRASRAMLRWGQSKLAEAAKASVQTIKRLEHMNGVLELAKVGTVTAIQRALESAGIEFTNGTAPGVRLKAQR